MFKPAYLKTSERGLLEDKIEQAMSLLQACEVCPHDCRVDRLQDERAVCRTGRYAQVSSWFGHIGEEDCLRGRRGSGTIFFSNCNLKCVFCQNHDISQRTSGKEVSPERLAEIMLALQEQGCHNINFVTPEHVVPQILEALPIAISNGLCLPLVYNTGTYDSMDSIRLMDGIIDIYMPDFKFWHTDKAKRYLKAVDYPDVARRIISEMHRQVGDLSIDERGIAKRGLLVRHLMMPGDLAGTKSILSWLSAEISRNTHINLMDQYRPAYKAARYPDINRRLTAQEYWQAESATTKSGLHKLP